MKQNKNEVFGITLSALKKKKFVFDFRKCEGGGSYTSFNIHRVPGEVVNGSKFLGFQFLNKLSWQTTWPYLHLILTSLLSDLITSTEQICNV